MSDLSFQENKDFSEDAAGSLLLDLSALLGYPLTLKMAGWAQGVDWTIVDESGVHRQSIFSRPGIPLSALLDMPEAEEWMAGFPAGVVEHLLAFEQSFQDYAFASLCFASRSDSAVDLLRSAPILLWLILLMAERQNWSEGQVLAMFESKRNWILKCCGLPAEKSFLKLLQKLKVERFRVDHLEDLVAVAGLPEYRKLNHLHEIDFKMLRFVLQNPALIGSRLLSHFSTKTWNWPQFEHDFVGIRQMSNNLRIADWQLRLGRCRNIQEVTQLHNALVEQMLNANLEDIPLIEFPAPPVAPTDSIQPVTDSQMLYREGQGQRHCVYSYRDRIIDGGYYVYQVLEPQRATVGLRINKQGMAEVDQIKLRMNQKPSADTLETVYSWLAGESEED